MVAIVIALAAYLKHARKWVPHNHWMVVARGPETRVLESGWHVVDLLRDEILEFNWTYNYTAQNHQSIRGTVISKAPFQVDFASFGVITREGVKVDVDPNLVLRVTDPVKALTCVRDPLHLLEVEIQPIVRIIVSKISVDELYGATQEIAANIATSSRDLFATNGLECISLTIEDIILPETYNSLRQQAKLIESQTAIQVASANEKNIAAEAEHDRQLKERQREREDELARVAHENKMQMEREQHQLMFRKAEIERSELDVREAEIRSRAAAVSVSHEEEKRTRELEQTASYYTKLIQAGFSSSDIVALETRGDLSRALFNSSKIYLPSSAATAMWLKESDHSS